MTEAEKAYQYFVIAVPESEEQAKAYFWARKALQPTLTPPNEPLMWEEFEAMIDKPVYIIELETRSYWALVHQVSDVGAMLTSTIDLHDDGSRGLYGKTWIAYRRPPEEDV